MSYRVEETVVVLSGVIVCDGCGLRSAPLSKLDLKNNRLALFKKWHLSTEVEEGVTQLNVHPGLDLCPTCLAFMQFTFAEQYLNAPSIRDIRLDELKPGMVIRGTFIRLDELKHDNMQQVKTLRVHSVTGLVVHSKSGSWAVGLSERLELIEDVPSTREVLATELARSVGFIWEGMPEVHREFYYGLADTAIKWAREPERTWEKAKEASADASFLEAADLADNPPVARPNVVAVGQPLMCIVCLRGAHWKIDGTSYCRDHAMSVFQELREKAKK